MFERTEMKHVLFNEREDWSFEKLDLVYEQIEKIATSELELDVYPNQIEIIDAEKMLDAYSSMALPVFYKHWSLGKRFISNQKAYSGGYQNLAYEVVINSSPCISYLQESNDMTMQTLVIAHAAFGHNAVFKNNEEFRRWTDAESILDELSFAKQFITRCEERYGVLEVEEVLDAAHALMEQGVDAHPRHSKSYLERTGDYLINRKFDQRLEDYDLIWEKTIGPQVEKKRNKSEENGEENLLYFIEKNAPNMPQWKREILRIVRKIAQYFYPQSQTKVLNEGFATMTHYYCMHRLHEKQLITDGTIYGFAQSHTNVISQSAFDDNGYSGLNPYALGFNIYRDIKRMCENPTQEDLDFVPHLKGKSWVEAVNEAMRENNDSSFISQYLSPKIIRDLKLFSLVDGDSDYYEVKSIHNDSGYEHLRSLLSEKYSRSSRVPRICVKSVDLQGDRVLNLKYKEYRGRPLEEKSKKQVLKYIEKLWGYKVELE